jgi:putative FmdB family regulatory protein
MPTYEYKCEKCAHTFEVFQSMKDESVKKCPKCGAKVRRVISTGAGIIFKGGGFYQTDYKSASGDKKGKVSGKKNGGGAAPCGKSDSCSCCGD